MNVLEGILAELKQIQKRLRVLEASEHYHPTIRLGSPTELTIAGGIVTRTMTYHTLDTEGDAATDDLDTINGGETGDLLLLRAINDARTVVLKDGTGNLDLAGDFSMDHGRDRILLVNGGGTRWIEIARSNNE